MGKNAKRVMKASCAVVACLALAAVAFASETEVVEMSAAEMPFTLAKTGSGIMKSQMSLVELRTQTLDAIRGMSSLSQDDMNQAKSMFMSMMSKFKSGMVRGDSLIASRVAEGAFGQQTASGSGLDLIFRKLNELEKKIKDEQKAEGTANNAMNVECDKQIKLQSRIITDSSKERTALNLDSDASASLINKNRGLWREQRDLEDKTHRSLVDLQTLRGERTEAIAGRVDERNKAIDVMQKALFIVCERFDRFKNGATCIKVKSQPDVDEPRRYTTNPAEEAEAQDKEFHAKDGDWAKKWAKRRAKDIDLEGVLRPENPEAAAPANRTGTLLGEDGIVEAKTSAPAKKKENLAQVLADEDEDVGKWTLSAKDQKTQKVLEHLAHKQMPDKYKMPLVQLALAIKEGATKRSKSIVQILMDVMAVTRHEQAEDKRKHNEGLEKDYVSSWRLWDVLKASLDEQRRLRDEMEARRVRILQNNKDDDVKRDDLKEALTIKHATQDQCAHKNQDFGEAEGYRKEDLENLVKLKSLLRMLYFKKKPTSCARNAGTKAICSGMDRGWCVFSDEPCPSDAKVCEPKNEQRCSCNVGFYGDACQYTMCPGLGKNLYPAQTVQAGSSTPSRTPGVCSFDGNEIRGQCNRENGVCTCEKGYCHGPKNACEWKHSPLSKGNTNEDRPDNTCSGRGRSYTTPKLDVAPGSAAVTYPNGYDKIRGICHCKNEFWGPACEYVKCPHSSGNIYPSTSSNACDGHGACSNENGKCTCMMPYHCGNSCSGMKDRAGAQKSEEGLKALRGLLEGNCQKTCPKGQSCEFEDCPDDCRASGKDACNMKTGKCSCKSPTFGPACEFRTCPDDCSGGGKCNRNDGKCICKKGFSGVKCEKTQRCDTNELHTPATNWWTLWDKPGWVTCPTGQLLYGLKRSTCDALSCINTASCAAACEGTGHIFQMRHCYHDLRWYDSFDSKGLSQCLPDYFMAGLYRSGESLYQLQMAKCCSLKEARWTMCGKSAWPIFQGVGTARVAADAFMTGIYRGEKQNLKGIEGATYCRFIRGY